MLRPHLRRHGGVWVCEGRGREARAMTLRNAYELWLRTPSRWAPPNFDPHNVYAQPPFWSVGQLVGA